MSDKPSPTSLVDLARLAGVTPGTVSRALSGTGLLSETTRQRIKALAEEHNYRPNLTARNLRNKRTGAIGVVIPLGHEAGQHVSDPFFMTLIGYLADVLTERGYDLLLSRVIPHDEGWLQSFVSSGRVDGTIVIGQSNQAAAIDAVARSYRPLVVWGACIESARHCTVGSDNRAGGEIAARYLIEKGCRRIAFFGDPVAPEFAHRLEGCETALKKAGLSPTEPVLPVHLMSESAHAAIQEYLAQREPPDGIVCASDIIAMSAIRALEERNIAVPEQVSVIGYDDVSIASRTNPPLTTVRQDLEKGAALLVDLLFRRMKGEETESVAMPPELVIRGSTRP